MKLRTTALALASALLSLGCPGNEGGVGGVLVVANVEVAPGIANVILGQTQQLTATAKTASGIAVSGRTVSWSSSDQSVATVSSAGMVTGIAVGGPVRIRATVDGITGDAVVTVRPVPVDHVTVEPAIAGVLVNGSVQLTATAFDAGNGLLDGRSFLWESSNSSIAAVTTTGKVIGQAEGGPVTISATAEGKTGSASVSVSTRPPTRLGFLQQPGLVIAGLPFSQPIRVALQDDFLGTVVGALNPVSIAIAGNPGGATLSGQTTVTPSSGIATFSTLSLNRVGNAYTFLVTSPGLQSVTSDPFDVIAGSANQLAFVTAPSSAAQSGVAFGQQPVLQLKDGSGNNVQQAGVVLTASIASGPAGAALLGTVTATTNAAGVASFTNLGLSGTVGSYTLGFGGSGVASLTSGPIALSPGLAAALFIATQPSSAAQSNTPLAQQPAVQLRDAAGNNVAQSGVTVTAAIATGPAGTLVGAAATTDATGLARFTSLAISGPSGTYTLTFASGGLTPVASGSIILGAGGATQLAMVTQPSSAAASGAVFAQQPAVQLRDASNNPVSQAGVSISASVSAGGTLLGTASKATDASGIASFTDLGISGLVGNYTLTFTVAGLTPVSSAPITLSAGAATQLTLARQPSSAASSGVAFATQPIIQLLDAAGNSVSQAGVTIMAVIASGPGGATLGGTLSATTSGSGAATFTNLAISGSSGSYTLRFSSVGLASATSGSVTLGAGAPTTIAANSATSQSAAINTAVAAPPSVKVTDASGNPVAGVAVTFAVASGGGTVVPAGPSTVSTNASGIATATSWTLGPSAGTNNNSVTATVSGLTGSPVTFTASGTTGSATTIAANSVTAQSATVGTAVAAPPSVKVTDAGNNPVAGVAVSFAVTAGGGTVVPASPSLVTTNAAGIATATSWTLGPTAGTNNNRVTATAAGLSGSPVAFTASGTAGAATTIAANSLTTQSAPVGTAVAAPPSVKVTDANSNPVGGVAITFAVTAGGGSVVPASPSTVTTNTSGIATATSWTLGPTAGTNNNRVTATAAGLSGSPVAFTASGTAGAATTITANSVTNQSATVGTTVSAPPSVKVTDANSNPVGGVAITFAVTAGGGSVVPASPSTVSTDVAGIATATSWSLGPTAGTNNNTVTATAPGLTGSPVTFTASGTAGSGTRITILTQPSSSGQIGVPLAQPPVLQLRDNLNNPVAISGVTITVSVNSGPAASFSPSTATTNASGQATFSSLTITGVTGTRTLLFAAAGYVSDQSGTVTLSAGPAASITANSLTSQSATAGSAVPTPPSVKVTDASGNPVQGTAVAFAVTAGGGTVVPASPSTVSTNASGVATATSWTLGPTAGTNNNTVTATASGLSGSPVTFTASGTAGPATTIVANSVTSQSATAGTAVAAPPSVKVTDTNNNPVAGVAVAFAVTAGGGTVVPASPTTVSTNAAGIATATSWTLGPAAGTNNNTVMATASGLSGSPVSFTASGTTGGATTLVANSAISQSATVGTTVSAPPSVKVTDLNGNGVQGVTVTFTLTAGGGTTSPASPASISTDVAGVASLSSWSLGTTAGTNNNTVTATATGLSGSPVTFNASGTAGPGATIVANSATSQSATVGTAVAAPPSVKVTDANNNPVAGVAVTFMVTAGGGATSPASPASINTNGAGVASLTSWTLGPSVGTDNNTLTATATGLSGSPVTFAASGTTAPATSITANSATSQSATAGNTVAAPPSVKVTDVNNNPVAGVAVTFTVVAGGGSTSPASPASINTDAAGIATLTSWTLGTAAGTANNSVTATATGLSGSPVTFTASGTPGAAAIILANSAQSQSANVGTAVAAPPSVKVTDLNGNGVQSVAVTFTVMAGGGTTSPASPASINTDAAGLATLTSWTLGPAAGTDNNTLTATATGLSGSPVTFTASGTAANPTTIAANSAVSQSATVGTVVAAPPSVKVTDAGNNPVAGVAVVFALTAGGGSISPASPATVNTDPTGVATLTSWTLGTAAGTDNNTVTATVTGLSGSPVTFNASGTPGPAATITANSATSQSATAGAAVGAPPSALVTDANGNPKSGVAVTFTLTAGGGTIIPASPATVNTNSAGVATLTSWTLGPTAGTDNNTVTAAVTGLTGSPVTFLASGTAGPAAIIVANSVTSQTATTNTAVAAPPSVKVTDANSNDVSGIAVTFTLTAGAGSTSPASPATINTNGAGVATLTSWTVGGTAGTNNNTVTGTATGLTGSPVTFSASGTSATQIFINQQPSSSGTSGTAFAQQPSVRLRDASNSNVSQSGIVVSVSLQIVSGSGTLNGTLTATTSPSGVAAFSGLSITGSGTFTLLFTSGNLTAATSTTITIP